MIAAVRHDVGRMATFTAILLMISVASLTAGCASVGRNRSSLRQLAPAGGRAEVIPGSWERVEVLRRGSPLVVTLKSGDRLEGGFKALASGVLALTDSAGKEFSIPRSEVRRIVAQASRDKLTNGALIGAGIGLGAALAILAIVGSADGYVLPSAKWGAPLLLSSVGSLIGTLVDRAHKRQEMIYVAP